MKQVFRVFWGCTLAAALALTGCHKHVSAAPATCTEPEICTECGKVMTDCLLYTSPSPRD